MKNLTEITDSECLDVTKILGGGSHLSDEAKIFQVKELLARRYNGATNLPGMAWYRAFQYLESCGYTIDDNENG